LSTPYEELSVLVIDDMATARRFAQNTLFRLRFDSNKVFVASNSSEAMNIIKKNDMFDLILCDYNLGRDEINGQQILENIKIKKLISNETLFFMVTAESNLQMVSSALEYMPDHYINKPYQPKMLSDRIQYTLEKKSIMSKVFKCEFKNELEEAIKECDIALDLNPKFRYYILNCKAHILKHSKLYKEASLIYHKLSLKQPENYNFLLNFIECQLYLNNTETSEELLKKLLLKNTKNFKVFDLLSKIATGRRDYVEAQKYKEEAIKISPNSIARQEELLNLAEKNNDFVIIEKSLKSITKLDLNSLNKDNSRHIRFIESHIDRYFYSEEKKNKKDLSTLSTLSSSIKNNLNNLKNITEKDKNQFFILDFLISLTLTDVVLSKELYQKIKICSLEDMFNNKYFYLIFEEAYRIGLFDELKEIMSLIDIYKYPSTVFEEAYFRLLANDVVIKNIDIISSLNESGIDNFKKSIFSYSYCQFTRALEKINEDSEANIQKTTITLNAAESLKKIIEYQDHKNNLDIEQEKEKIKKLLNDLDKNDIKNENISKLNELNKYYTANKKNDT
jgi:CheY-like chemotaxis protein